MDLHNGAIEIINLNSDVSFLCSKIKLSSKFTNNKKLIIPNLLSIFKVVHQLRTERRYTDN